MMTRFESIKAGATEDGVSLNNVDKTLQSVGLSLRDANGNFIALGTIIDEIGQKWSTLDDFQKRQLITSIAGVRQSNAMIALFDNYGKSLEYQTAQTESAGLAQQRYGAYLDSVAASAAKAQTAWQGLWSDTINSQGIKFFYDLSSAIANIIDKSGGLNTVLMILGTTLLFLKGDAILGAAGAFLNYVSSINLATGATTIFNAVLDANPLGLIALAISGIIIAFNAFGDSAKNLSDKIQSLQSDYNNLLNSFNQTVDAKKSIDVLGNQLDNLRNKTSLSADDQKKLIDVQNQLKQVMPSLSGEYDSQGNFILNESVNIKTLNTLLQQKLDLEQQELNLKASDMIKAETDAYVKQAETLSNLQKGQATFTPWGIQNKGQLQQATSEAAAGVQQSLNTIETAYEGFDAAQKKAFLDYLDSLGKSGAALKEQLIQLDAGTGTINNYASAVTNYADAGVRAIERDAASIGDYADAATRALNSQKETIQAVIPQLESLDTTLKTLQSDNKTLDDIIKKSGENKVTFEDIQKLLALSPDYINALTIEGDTVKVNTDLLKQYQISQIDKTIADQKAAGATDQQIAVLEAYKKQLIDTTAISKSYVDSFNNVLGGIDTNLSGDKTAFEGFAKSIVEVNNEFKNGTITANQYFTILKQQISSANLVQMFGNDKKAADSFFTGLVSNAANALAQLTTDFRAGNINVANYLDGLKQLDQMFVMIGNMASTFGSTLGLTGQQIDAIKSSTDSLSGSIGQLASLTDAASTVMEGMSGKLVFGSKEFDTWAQSVANALVSVGGQWTTASGEVLKSSQDIYNYATAANGNMEVLVNELSARINDTIKNVTGNIANLLNNLAKGIADFHGDIYVTPKISGQGLNVPITILGQPIGGIQIPSVDVSVSSSFQGVANAISGIASSIQSWGASNPVNLSNFINPAGFNQISGAAGAATNSVADLGKALSSAASGAKNLTSELNAMKTTAENALNAQLAGYKSIIDAQKQMIDNTLKQKTYEEDIANQNQSIAQIKNRLLAIQFDTSDAANAERLTLTDELNKAQTKLSDTEAKQSADVQKAALDADYAAFETKIKTAVDAIKALNSTTVSDLAKQISAIFASLGNPPKIAPSGIQTFHSGIDVGFAGGVGGNEIFARLMKGEAVISEDQMNRFVNRTLPQITANATNSNVTFGKLFDLIVQGNLDSSVMPDLEKLSNDIVNRINQTLTGRGYTRQTQVTGVV